MEETRKRGFAKGHPRYGGRRKGSVSKRTKQAREIAESLGFHPIEWLSHVAVRGTMPNPDGSETPVEAGMRLDAAKAAAPYIVPRLSATQVTGADDAPVQVNFPTQALLADPVMADKMADLALWVALNGDSDGVARGRPALPAGMTDKLIDD
jgi:hypothetical protein